MEKKISEEAPATYFLPARPQRTVSEGVGHNLSDKLVGPAGPLGFFFAHANDSINYDNIHV